jgi:hypothetical protein
MKLCEWLKKLPFISLFDEMELLTNYLEA